MEEKVKAFLIQKFNQGVAVLHYVNMSHLRTSTYRTARITTQVA